MKIIFLALSLALAGCATNTFEKRRTERLSAYNTLTPEFKSLVDQGKIKIGMPEDAVYIAWGKPSEILRKEDAKGPATTWLYEGTYLQEYRYWSQPRYDYGFRGARDYNYGYYTYGRPETDYVPHDYVTAEVEFVNGIVKKWEMRPRPR